MKKIIIKQKDENPKAEQKPVLKRYVKDLKKKGPKPIHIYDENGRLIGSSG